MIMLLSLGPVKHQFICFFCVLFSNFFLGDEVEFRYIRRFNASSIVIAVD